MPTPKYPAKPFAQAKTAIVEGADRILSDSLNAEHVLPEARFRPIHENDQEDIERIAPRGPTDNRWTREAWLQGLWASSRMRADLDPRNEPTQLLVKLWKTCCAFMRCSPMAIISPRYGLHYIPTSFVANIDVDDDSADDDILRFTKLSVFPIAICGHLARLVCQPLWRGDPSMLATAIQYAVICRTKNHDPWRLALAARNITEMETLRQRALSDFSDQPVQEYIEQQCLDGLSRRDRVPSELLFLCHLGSHINENKRQTHSESQLSTRLSFGIYSVTVIDLESILGALDTFSPDGRVIVPAEMVEQIRRVKVSNKGYPSARDVFDLHARAHLHEFRLYFQQKQTAATLVPDTARSLELRPHRVDRPASRRPVIGSSRSVIEDSEDDRAPRRQRPRRRTSGRHSSPVAGSSDDGDFPDEDFPRDDGGEDWPMSDSVECNQAGGTTGGQPDSDRSSILDSGGDISRLSARGSPDLSSAIDPSLSADAPRAAEAPPQAQSSQGPTSTQSSSVPEADDRAIPFQTPLSLEDIKEQLAKKVRERLTGNPVNEDIHFP